MSVTESAIEFDLAVTPLRELNAALHAAAGDSEGRWRVLNPRGAHAVAVGVDAPLEIDVEGHVGYYCAGMNKQATVHVHGNAGVGLAENIMSGTVIVDGSASQSAAATGRGGLVVVRGSAAARCGISMKGVDIVVHGSVGHMSAFMAQKGCLVVCGDAGDALGDSIYEARLYVRGSVAGLGADCVEKEMRDEHEAELAALLERAEVSGARARAVPPLRLGAAALQLRRRQRRRVLSMLREGAIFDRRAIAEIQRAAREGIYDIRGFGAKRVLPHFDDLVFLGASVSRYPLEGYRERCDTDVVLGDRNAKKPLHLQIPITIAGMSFGALSAPAKEALGAARARWAPAPPPATAA